MKFDPLHPVPCVYFKHGAYWYVKKGVWLRIGTTLEEALAAYGRLVQQKAEGDLPKLLERAFAHHRKVKALAGNTLAQYRLALDVLARRLRTINAGQLRMRHVAQFKAEGAAHPNMTNRQLSLLRTLYGYLVEWQLVDTNPCVGIKRLDEARRKRYLTDAEFAAIREHAEPRLQVIMDLQYLTGQRIGDVLRIHRKDLTEDGIFFKPQKTSASTGARICVRWTDDLRVAVGRARELQGRVSSLWLLGSRTNKAPDYSTVAQQFRNAVAAAGVEDARPNDQRAKALTDVDQQGSNATALAAHADPQMTQRYLRLFRTVMVDGPSRKR